MGNNVAPAQTNFNAGELSPLLEGRVDLAKFGNGCHRMRNFKPTPQGPAVRRTGSRHVTTTKTMTHRSWLWRFVFSEDDSYVLEFGDGYIRFYVNNGQLNLGGAPAAYNGATAYVPGDLVSSAGVNYYCKAATTGNAPPNATYWHPLTGTIYEIASPYAIGDLTDTDGTFRLDFEQTGDVIFITHPSYPPKKLARFGATNWTISDASITNGPFEDVNPDQTTTVYASATTGNITLTASASIFTSAHVGTLFLLEQKKIDGYAVWEVAKAIALNAERRSDSNVYQALNADAATTGSVKPTHREGAKFDGDTGVQWQYLHSGYGIARITSLVSGTVANATVVSTIPSQAVGVGNASTKWAFAAWRSDVGYPSLVKIFRERLCFLRGQKLWGSVAASLEDFAARDGAETLPDSAFSIEISSGETNSGVWMVAQDALLVGTRGAEFAVSEVTNSEVFGPGNIKSTQSTKYGGRQVKPGEIGDSTLFSQRSGQRVRDMRYSFNTNGYEANDLMVLSDHVARGQLIQMAFALEPHSILWACCENGDLLGLTYLLEQDVLAWHPHSIGGGSGEQGMVESVVVIPSPDGDHDQVWMQVYRVINGNPTRYIEYLEKDWHEGEQELEDAVFSDSAATFDGFLAGATGTISGGTTWAPGETGLITLSFVPVAGDVGDYLVVVAANGEEAKVRVDAAANPAPVTFITAIPASLRGVLSTNLSWARDTITGLAYLEGEEVTLTVNGAAHPRVTVTGGAITLQSPASKVQVGLPADAELITMRIEGGAANGTSQGKIKRTHRGTFRLHESLGGSAGPEGGEQLFEYRAPANLMDQPPPTLTGDYQLSYDEGYTMDARIRVLCNQPLPFTLVAIFPQLVVEDRM